MLNKIIKESEYLHKKEELTHQLLLDAEIKKELTHNQKDYTYMLLLFRPAEQPNEKLAALLDEVLSYENYNSLIDVTSKKFIRNTLEHSGNVLNFNADVVVLFSPILAEDFINLYGIDNQLLYQAGVGLKIDMYNKLKQDNFKLNYLSPYIFDGYNLKAKNVVKILLNLKNCTNDIKNLENEQFILNLKNNLLNLFKTLANMQVKFVAFDIQNLKLILKNINENYEKCVGEIKKYIINLNKKTKLSLIFNN